MAQMDNDDSGRSILSRLTPGYDATEAASRAVTSALALYSNGVGRRRTSSSRYVATLINRKQVMPKCTGWSIVYIYIYRSTRATGNAYFIGRMQISRRARRNCSARVCVYVYVRKKGRKWKRPRMEVRGRSHDSEDGDKGEQRETIIVQRQRHYRVCRRVYYKGERNG